MERCSERALRAGATVALAAALVAATMSCGAPTSPCDGRPPAGFNVLLVSCTPIGSDAQCSATADNNVSKCRPEHADVTSSAFFISSDTSVAVFGTPGTPPGYLKAVGTGNVTVTAQYLNLVPILTARLFLSPGVPSEHLVILDIVVENAITAARIPGASVVVTREGDSPKTCTTGSNGICGVQLRHGPLIIGATAANYEPGQTPFTPGPTSISVTATVKLTPK
jgi:hypothetical protein